MSDWGKLLRLVRRYTGDAFSPQNGYDLRKPLNFGQRMAVLRYANKINELTSQNHVLYKPKRGEKTEAFSFTGQSGWRKFNVAIVHAPNVKAKLSFEVDKSRPRGSRFIAIDRRNGQRYYHIPAKVFLDAEEEEDLSETEAYQQILEDYAADADIFLINAGESYMWGAGGGHEQVAKKIQAIFQNYGDSMFSAANKNSSHYSNWFRGVTGWTDFNDIRPAMADAFRKKRERAEKYHIDTKHKYRRLRDGSIGQFRDGELLDKFWIEEYQASYRVKYRLDGKRGQRTFDSLGEAKTFAASIEARGGTVTIEVVE